MPEHFVEIYHAYMEGNIEKAREEQKIATEICEVLQNGSDMGIFKAALEMRGINSGHMRSPLIDLDYDEKVRLKKSLEPYLF